jgi:peptidoglycan/LPS O-acetylase OafA/YrhL
MQNPKFPYRPDIDGLRALAIVLVLVVHAFPSWLSGGFIGVDVFFVISGFLIGSILLTEMKLGHFSFLGFYVRRVNRIFPALIVVLIACLAFGWFSLFPVEFKSLGRSTAAGAGFLANINQYTEVGYWDVAGKLKPLLHLWSLGVEEQFYFAFPFLLWCIYKARLHLVGVLLLCVLASGWLTKSSMNSDQAAAFYLPLHRAWELLVGALLAAHSMAHPGRHLRPPSSIDHLIALLGLTMILIASFFLDKTIHFPGKWSLLPVGGAVLLIAAGPKAWINRLVFSHPVAIYIGLISFPLYLWHWPLISFAHIVDSGSPITSTLVAAIGLSILLAIATYHLLEKPLRQTPLAPGLRALGLSLLLATVGVAGYAIYRFDGILSRSIARQHLIDPFGILRPPVVQDDSQPCFKALPERFKHQLQHGQLPGTQVHCQAQRVEDVSMVLLGDSNAGQYAKDLHDHYGPKLMTIHSSGRPYIHNVNHDEASQDILRFLLQQPGIKTIILSHLGVELTQGDAPTLTEPQRLNVAYLPGLEKTIRDFQAVGKRVIWMGSIPVLNFDPKRCQTRPYTLNPFPGRCSIPRNEIEQTHSPYLSVLRQLRADMPDMEIIDAMDSLCDKQTCYAKKDGVVLYADKKHVNLYGSSLITAPLIRLLH